MSESQTIKTLIHEIAHAKLHNKDGLKNRNNKFTNFFEVEAESVAFIVSNHLGIDTSEYSFGYIAGWSESKELKELMASLELIQGTSSELIKMIDEKLSNHLALNNKNTLKNENNTLKFEKIDNKNLYTNQNKNNNNIKERIKEKQEMVNRLKQDKQQKQQANRL